MRNDRETVAIASCTKYEEDEVRRAMDVCLQGAGGLDWAKPGMTVGIKVNLVSGMAPEKAGTTHPALVKELASRLCERGCKVIIGDSPGGIYNAHYVKAIYHACRMEDALVEGASLNEDFSVREANFPEAVSIKTFQYTGWLDSCDALINFAKFKTHAMMSMSCSVKNLFGTIPGITKPEYHMRFPETQAFSNVMVDLNEYFRPVLNIIDAVEGMEGNGPTNGTPTQVGKLLASTSPYALDLVCAAMMGLGSEDVPTIKAAMSRRIGPRDLGQVDLVGEDSIERLSEFRLITSRMSTTFGGHGIKAAFSPLLRWVLATKPQVRRGECIGCAKCRNICPAHAIEMKDKLPVIDREKCIHCFCCQEFCPKGAMKVAQNPIGRIVRRINTI